MRKTFSAFLSLLLVLTLGLASCKDNPIPDPNPNPTTTPELTLANATTKIEFYFNTFFYGHTKMLKELGLMTEAQITSMFEQKPKDYPDDFDAGIGYGYYETGVLYADFERACLQHLSKSFFSEFSFCCLLEFEDKLVYAASGHGGLYWTDLSDITDLGSSGGRYRYAIDIELFEYDESAGVWRYEFIFILENGKYVIDEMKVAE